VYAVWQQLVQQKIIWQIQRATMTAASLSKVRSSLRVAMPLESSYFEGPVQRAERAPRLLYLKTPVVMMAARFRQQHRLPQHAARPRAWKLQAPRIIRPELAASSIIVTPQRA